MNLPQEYINAVTQLKDLPVNIETDGLTVFMLIAQLQLALRHAPDPPWGRGNAGESANKIRELAIDLQNQLTSRVHGLKPMLERGLTPASRALARRSARMRCGWHPEFDMSTNERIVDVHNVYSRATRFSLTTKVLFG